MESIYQSRIKTQTCQICYEKLVFLLRNGIRYDACIECDQAYCIECLQEWMVYQIKNKYFKQSEEILLMCPTKGCQSKYTLFNLYQTLDKSGYQEVCEAISIKYLQSNEDYLSCPNIQCKNYGYLQDQCCPSNIQCQSCNFQWRIPSQRSIFWIVFSPFLFLTDNNFQSNLYKVLFSQGCPNCKVMIVRLGGCKFMECGKCNYQFCWWCLSEFYTQYHFYESLCPLRILPIYFFIGIFFLFIYLKIVYMIPYLLSIQSIIFYAILKIILYTIQIASIVICIKSSFLIIYKKYNMYLLQRNNQRNIINQRQRFLNDQIRFKVEMIQLIKTAFISGFVTIFIALITN